jgi:O-antigen ligase
MMPITLLGFSLLLNLRRLRWRALSLAGAGVAFGALAISQTRGAMLGLAIGGLVIVVATLVRGRLSWRQLGAGILVLAILALAFRDQIVKLTVENLLTDHFQLELQSRLELNDVALRMLRDSPLFGMGVNNFQMVLDNYTPYGVIYVGFAAHNLYLLVLAETGVIGFAGLLATFGVLLWFAFRLARVPDRFMSAVGIGVAAVYVAFYLEELLGFALRHDVSRSVFWIAAGLSVACWRIARERSAATRGGPNGHRPGARPAYAP